MGRASAKHDGVAPQRAWLWRIAWIVVALAYAAPLAWNAYHAVIRANHEARARLIVHHRLWEVDPNFGGKPEVWTRFASRLLTDRQILTRLKAKYEGRSEEIEVEYRRDLTMARAEVVVIALGLWAGPLGALYGIVWLMRRRRRVAPPVKTVPASASDPRYLPPS